MTYYSWYEHACKNSEYFQAKMLVNIYLCIRILVILHNELLYKYEFGQAHYQEQTKRTPTKFSFPFFDIPTSFYEFWKFELFFAI
jgi:hypothetical protein